MTNTLLKLATPLAAIFMLSACAAHRESLHQAATQTAVALSTANDFRFVAGCNGDKGRSGVLSYSESTDQYRLQLVTGNKVDVIQAKQDPADNNAPFDKLNHHCYPE